MFDLHLTPSEGEKSLVEIAKKKKLNGKDFGAGDYPIFMVEKIERPGGYTNMCDVKMVRFSSERRKTNPAYSLLQKKLKNRNFLTVFC